MNLRSIGLALGLAALSITASSLSARALDLSLSFPVSTSGSTTANSTVSGIIQGLQDNTTNSVANDIIITSDPVGIPNNTSLAYQSGYFTVANGKITNISNVEFQTGNETVLLNYTSVPSSPPNSAPVNTNEISYGTTAASISQNGSFITASGSPYTVQPVPWEFNPGEMIGLGVPLMMGLRVLGKKLALR